MVIKLSERGGVRTLEETDAGVEKLLRPGGGGAQVEAPDLLGAAAEQLQGEGGADEALPARHREPHTLDPLVLADQIHVCVVSVRRLVWCWRWDSGVVW